MKKLLFAITILLIVQTASAQYHNESDGKNIYISAGGEIGAPSNTPYNFTYGASAQAEVKLLDRIGLTLTGEFIGYKYKNTLFANSNATHPSIIPLKAGIKYYTSPSFFLGGELGSTIQSNTVFGNMVVYSLGFGFDIPLDKRSDIEVAFSYQNFTQSQYQTTGMKVAYKLGWWWMGVSDLR